MTARQSRVGRGLIVAVLATFFAAFSHGTADGQAPSLLALAIAFVLAVAVSVALAGRRLTLVRLAGSVALSQIIFHLLFAFLPRVGGTATILTSADAAASAGHRMHGAASHSIALVPDSAMMSSAHQHLTPSMLVAHGLAALVTIALVWRGQRVLGQLIAAVRLVIRALVEARTATPIYVRSRARRFAPSVRRALGIDVLSAMRYRGPPLGAEFLNPHIIRLDAVARSTAR